MTAEMKSKCWEVLSGALIIKCWEQATGNGYLSPMREQWKVQDDTALRYLSHVLVIFLGTLSWPLLQTRLNCALMFLYVLVIAKRQNFHILDCGLSSTICLNSFNAENEKCKWTTLMWMRPSEITLQSTSLVNIPLIVGWGPLGG